MKVTLLAYTTDAEVTVATAGRVCYSKRGTEECNEHFKEREDDSGLVKQLSVIHGSCFEHASFTFGIDGVSRVTTHQLVRHRMASYSQQSQRYVDIGTDARPIIPPTVRALIDEEDAFADMGSCYCGTLPKADVTEAIGTYEKALRDLLETLQRHNVPSEDRRYFAPQGIPSSIVVTMNARELQHFLGLRMCKRAQWEIRELAERMCALVTEACPHLAEALHLGASCESLGYCPEHKSCGRHPTLAYLDHIYKTVTQ